MRAAGRADTVSLRACQQLCDAAPTQVGQLRVAVLMGVVLQFCMGGAAGRAGRSRLPGLRQAVRWKFQAFCRSSVPGNRHHSITQTCVFLHIILPRYNSHYVHWLLHNCAVEPCLCAFASVFERIGRLPKAFAAQCLQSRAHTRKAPCRRHTLRLNHMPNCRRPEAHVAAPSRNRVQTSCLSLWVR